MRIGLYVAAGFGSIALGALQPAQAVVFSYGNQQYTNVNIAADTDAMSITGELDNTGIYMTFDTMIGPDGSSQVSMHGQHGVAFVESTHDSTTNPHTGFSSITLNPTAGYVFSAGDFALDLLNGLSNPSLSVTFSGLDERGNAFSDSSLQTDANGQSQYNFSTPWGFGLSTLVITVPYQTDMLQDIKQVSLSMVPFDTPEPASLAVLGAGIAAFGVARRHRRAG